MEYTLNKILKNIQPINPNAIYLSEINVNQITIEKIEESIKNFADTKRKVADLEVGKFSFVNFSSR